MLSNEQRTTWIQSQAVGDEKPTGNQTGVILRGTTSLVYLGVTSKGLSRPFRVHFINDHFPYWVVFSIFDPRFSDFHATLIHWTQALHFLRATNAVHNVERILWNEDLRDGWSFAKWIRHVYDDRYNINDVLVELPAVPEVLS